MGGGDSAADELKRWLGADADSSGGSEALRGFCDE